MEVRKQRKSERRKAEEPEAMTNPPKPPEQSPTLELQTQREKRKGEPAEEQPEAEKKSQKQQQEAQRRGSRIHGENPG